ncbi:MAG TPA: ATP-binding protein [bacterium]|nr:ATP-binding protein [bacterium]
MKIRTKLLAAILTPVLAVLVILSVLSYRMSRQAIVSEIKQRAEFMLRSTSNALYNGISGLEDVAKSMSIAMEAFEPSSEESLQKLIHDSIEMEKIIFGSTIAFEPGAFPGRAGQFAPYYHRNPEGLVFVDLASPAYNYPGREWYRIPVETKKPYWTEPYMDVGGGDVPMVTYAHPVMQDGSVRGVATIDISLEELTGSIKEIKIGETGFAFLTSRMGAFITMRGEKWSPQNTILALADELKSEELKSLGARMISGETGFVSLKNPLDGRQAWFAFGPIESTNWSLCLVFPEEEMLGAVLSLNHRMIAVSAAGILFLALLIFLIASRITRPISALAEAAGRIAEGDFSAAPPGGGGKDEIGTLARSFSDMAGSLSATLSKLRSEKELFSASFSQMSDGLVIIGPDLSPIKANRAAERLLSLPAQGSMVEHILSHFECSPPIDRITDFGKGPPAFELTRRASETAGALHLMMVATPVRGRDGEVENIILAVRDVTELKADELSKKDFLSTISHKLRTPVAVLQSSVFLIKDRMLGDLNEKQQKHASMMSDQVAKLAALIEKLIAFVTLEEQSLSAAKEKIELGAFISGIAEECSKLHPDSGATIDIEVSPEAAEIEFNRDQLRIIICELLQNALKFNPGEKPSVRFRCSRDGERLTISVEDDGTGIPPELHDRIFEKFFQAERYFTGNVEGVGLGLTFVKKIVDFAGGSVTVQSEPGKGSTFTVKLPTRHQ